MLEFGGIRSQRQSRQRPLPTAAAVTAVNAVNAAPFLSSASVAPPTRKRPLPAEQSALTQHAQPPTTRVKLEADKQPLLQQQQQRQQHHQQHDQHMRLEEEEETEEEEKTSIDAVAGRRRGAKQGDAGVPFVSIRHLRQQHKQARARTDDSGQQQHHDGQQGNEEETAAVAEHGRRMEQGSAADEPVEVRSVTAPTPSVVLLEPISAPAAPYRPSASLNNPTAVNFKRFHKSAAHSASTIPSAAPNARPASSISIARLPPPHLVVSDSGDGCSLASEVDAVRRADHIDRLTAQMDGPHTAHISNTGKRKR